MVSAILILNLSNLNTALHEIAQVALAKELYDAGHMTVLEYPVGHKEADISDGAFIWEVKPITYFGSSQPDKQLGEYLMATGLLPGFAIRVSGIHIVKNYYMSIMSTPLHPGIEYYYFYQITCQNKRVEVSPEKMRSIIREKVDANLTVGIIVAAAIIVATIVEDVLTYGGGIADDIASLVAALSAASSIIFS